MSKNKSLRGIEAIEKLIRENPINFQFTSGNLWNKQEFQKYEGYL